MVASGNILEREAEQEAKDKATGTRRFVNLAAQKKRDAKIAAAKSAKK